MFDPGLQYGYQADPIRQTGLVGIHGAALGQSNFCSLADIAIGTIRWCLTRLDAAAKRATCVEMLAQLEPMCWEGWDHKVYRWCVDMNPQSVWKKHQRRYALVGEMFKEAGMPIQVPSEKIWGAA